MIGLDISSVTFFKTIIGHPVHGCMLSHFSRVWLFATPWAVACQALLSMGFSRQNYWSGLPCLLQGCACLHACEIILILCPFSPHFFALRLLSHFSRVWLFVTPWTVAYQDPLSMGFSRHEYWSGLLFPSLYIDIKPYSLIFLFKPFL